MNGLNGLAITYLGQCGFLLDFGNTRIATDPYLSDYVDKTCFSVQTPWRRLYPPPANLLELRPDGILISHSHEDHLDPWTLQPYLSKNPSCKIAAPAPECEKLKRLGASNILHARAEESFCIGSVKVTPIPCAHTQLHTDEAGRFRELSYILEWKNNIRLFFGGDMSLYDGLDKRLREAECSLLLLPVNGGDAERTGKGIIGNIDCYQAASLAAKLNVPYIPMHHDLYAINGCAPEEILRAAEAANAKAYLLKPMQSLRVTKTGAVQPA
jgi:L-ascorbate metabolism protein UlaG (beta-lactamase superfamily)